MTTPSLPFAGPFVHPKTGQLTPHARHQLLQWRQSIIDAVIEEVTTAMLEDGILSADAEGRSKMANGYLVTDKIDDLQITADKIGTAAITGDKIDDAAITTGKIDDLQITADKIGNLEITSDKIAVGAVSAINSDHTEGDVVLDSDEDDPGDWETLQTTTITTIGGRPVVIDGSNRFFNINTDLVHRFRVEIRRNGTTIRTQDFPVGPGNARNYYPIQVIDTGAGGGSTEYEMRARYQDTVDGATITLDNRFLRAMEFRR